MRIIPALALALSIIAPAAQAGEAYTAANGLALAGHDVVAYFGLEQSEIGTPQPEAVPGQADITAEYDGATYAFASAANRDAFVADPAKYVPQYDGHCAFGVSKGGKVPGNPDLWRIVDGKLYLNITRNVVGFWEEDIAGNIGRAETNWPDLEPAPASTDPIPAYTPDAPLN